MLLNLESAHTAEDGPMGLPMETVVAETRFGTYKFAPNETLMMPNGNVVGKTRGIGAENVGFCIDCHMPLGEDQDSLLFLPDAFRK